MVSGRLLSLVAAGCICIPQGLVSQTTRGERLAVRSVGADRMEGGGMMGRYSARRAQDLHLEDFSRIDSLVRAGILYLSLRDAIDLAIENNLDIELQRLTPVFAEADLERARAGGVARGVPITIRQGPGGLGGASPTQSPFQTISAGEGAAGDQSLASGNALNPSGNTGSGASGPAVPVFDPSLVGSLGWNRAKSPQTNTFITGTNALTSTVSNGGLGLQKGFLTGATASLGLDAQRQNTNNPRSDVNPNTSGGLELTFTQPLLRGFGPAVNSRYIRIARNNRQVSDLAFEQQLIETVYTVVGLYWDLVSLTGAVRVQRQSLELAERLLKESLEQERAGTAAPIDVVRTRAEVASSRRDLTIAETRMRQQETILKDYLTRGVVSGSRLAALHLVPTDAITTPAAEPVAPLADLVAAAAKQRPDLLQASLQAESSRIALVGSRSSLLPSVDLVLNARSAALYGSISTLPPVSSGGSPVLRQPDPGFLGGPATGLNQIFTGRFPDYGVQVQVNIPLLNRAAQADYARDQLTVRQQEIRLRQAQKQVSLDVVNAQIAVEQARAAYEAALEARAAQEQLLQAEQKKLAAGASTNVALIGVSRDLSAAESAEVLALDDYAKARAALDRATGGLLEVHGISVAGAFSGRAENPVKP